MPKCWAASLGGCGKKQSREHYMSQVLFGSDKVEVRGFDWLNGATAIVPLDRLSVKSLCDSHNSGLSDLDAGAGAVFDTIKAFAGTTRARASRFALPFWPVELRRIDAAVFERWAAKCVVGCFTAIGKNGLWRSSGTGRLQPPVDVVRAIHGLGPFPFPMGLYTAHANHEPAYFRHSFTVEPLRTAKMRQCVGGMIKFAGFRFVVWLDTAPMGDNITLEDDIPYEPMSARLLYRPAEIVSSCDGKRSQVMEFDWAGLIAEPSSS